MGCDMSLENQLDKVWKQNQSDVKDLKKTGLSVSDKNNKKCKKTLQEIKMFKKYLKTYKTQALGTVKNLTIFSHAALVKNVTHTKWQK